MDDAGAGQSCEIFLFGGEVGDRVDTELSSNGNPSTLPTHDFFGPITRANFVVTIEFDAPHRRQLPSGHTLTVHVNLRTILRKHAIDVADGRYAEPGIRSKLWWVL